MKIADNISILKFIVISKLWLFLLLLFSPSITFGQGFDELPDDMKNQITSRQKQIESVFSDGNVRGEQSLKIASISWFSEQAVLNEAKNLEIEVNDQEIETALIPFLSQQGLIDITTFSGLDSSDNVKKWLNGQDWSMEELKDFGKVLALWIKINIDGVSITSDEVVGYVEKNPRIGIIPDRVVLKIDKFTPGQGLEIPSRGVAQAQLVNPISSITRGDQRKIKATSSEEWDSIELYLPIERMDPSVRRAIAGKGENQKFGPVETRNGSIVEGTILQYLPETKLQSNSDAETFWKYATVMARLDKADQESKYNQIITSSVQSLTNPLEKRFFGTLFGIAGAAVGSMFGNPYLGAAVGGGLGGLIDRQMSPRTAQSLSGPTQVLQGMGQVVSPYIYGNNTQLPPISSGPFNPYPQAGGRSVPYYSPAYANTYNSFAHQMQSAYGSPRQWYPPFWVPMPVRNY